MIYKTRKNPIGFLAFLALIIIIGFILVTFSKVTGITPEAARILGF